MSTYADTPVDQIDFEDLSLEELQWIAENDERSTAQEAAKKELESREAPPPEESSTETPDRPEDAVEEDEEFEPVELTSPEVDLETQRKDETSSLATDRYDNEGNRVRYDEDGNRIVS